MGNPQIISEGELCHYGRKGMKWYQNIFSKNKKNGSKKRSEDNGEDDVEVKKQKILSSRSAKELYDNADLFTTQELQSAYNRLMLERNIASLQPAEINKGKQFMDDTTSMLKTVNNLAGTSIDSWNTFAKVYNVTSKGKENPLPIIKSDDKKKDEKGKKDSSNEQKPTENTNNQTNNDKPGKDTTTDSNQNNSKTNDDKTETWTGTVEGKGTSTYKEKEGPTVDADWSEVTVSGVPAVYVSAGKDFVDDLLK